MSMRRVVLMLFAVTAAWRWAAAQDDRRFEVFGGYSLESVAPCGHVNGGCGVELGDLLPYTLFNGWNAAATGYFSKSAGITADFSGHYHTIAGTAFSPDQHLSRYSYMFGPKFLFHPREYEKSTVFLQLLVGAVHEKSTLGGASPGTTFGARPGGGWDINLSRRLALRVAQVEYEYFRVPLSSVASGSSFTSGFRYSGGIVFH